MALIMIVMYNYFAVNKQGSLVLILLASMIGLLITVAIYLLVSRKMYLNKFVVGLSKILKWNVLDKLVHQVSEINLAIVAFYRMYKPALLIGLTLFTIHWILGALEFYVILYLLDVPIRLVDTLFLEFGTSFIRSLVAFVPGQIGIEEYSNKYFLGAVHIKDEGVWVTVSIVRRLRQLFWIGLSLIYYLMFIKANKQTTTNHIKVEYENPVY